MTRKKESKAWKSATLSGLKRLLYFRYGSLGLEADFTLAKEVFTTGSIPPDLSEQVDDRGLDVFINTARLVEMLRRANQEAFDETRFRLTVAYFDFLRHFDRAPTQKELLQHEWRLRIASSPSAAVLSAGEDALSKFLNRYQSGKAQLPKGMPAPMDRRNGSALIKELGFPLLDGQALPTYRSIFNSEAFKGEPPSLQQFLSAATTDPRVKHRVGGLPRLFDLPLDRMLEVIGSPFEIHPFTRWAHSHEAQSTILHQFLAGRTDLDESVKNDVKEVHELLFQLGLKLDLLHQGTDSLRYSIALRRLAENSFEETGIEGSSNFLSLPAEESRSLHQEFHATAETLGALPDFGTFWLSRPRARAIAAKSPDIPATRLAVLETFARAYQIALQVEALPLVKNIADGFVPVGILAECFEKSHRLREPIIFWGALMRCSRHDRPPNQG